jgi:hypothetical protein
MAGRTFEDLVFKVIADTKSAQEGLEKISGKVQDLNKHTLATSNGMEKFFSKAKVGAGVVAAAFTVAATAISVFAIKAIQAGAENDAAGKRLELTLKNVTGASEDAAAAANEYVRQLTLMSGVSEEDLRPALDQLARATRNLADAQGLLSLSMDVSAGTGIDELTVATALGQAYKGNYSQLTRLKTGLSETTIATGDFKKITGELADMFKGQADQAANSFIGQTNRMHEAFKDMQEQIGVALVPIMELLLNIINSKIIPALRNWVKYLEANPKAVKELVKAVAWGINFMAEFGAIVLYATDGLVQLLYYLSRSVQGFGWLFQNKAMKDWGRETAESLKGVSAQLQIMGDKLHNFDANLYMKDINFQIKLPTGKSDYTGATGPKGAAAAVEAGWNDAAKAILDAAKKIKIALTEVLGFSLKKEVAKLNVDVLTQSLQDAKVAAKDYTTAQNGLIKATQKSTQADIAYLKSLVDVTDAGKAKTASLKEAANVAKDSAISAAEKTNQALQRIAEAQKTYANEVIARVNSIRDAFKSATSFSMGTTATAIADAKKNLADAEQALTDVQSKFKSSVGGTAYEGVILNTVIPLFESEKAAVTKAKKDLAVALGTEINPYAATLEELQTAMKNAYNNAVELSKVAGDLSARGFSQDFITSIIEAGPVLGTALGKQILNADMTTQDSMKKLYGNMIDISKHGVDQLSIDLNQGAIDAMEGFMSGLQTIQDPLNALIATVEQRVLAMVKTIMDAIAAAIAALQALMNMTPTSSGSAALKAISSSTTFDQMNSAINVAAGSSATASQIANTMATTLLKNKQMTTELGGTTGVLSSARYTGQAIEWAKQTGNTQVTVVVSNPMPTSADIGAAAAWGIKTSQDTAFSPDSTGTVDRMGLK